MMIFVLFGVAAITAIVRWSRGGIALGVVAALGATAFADTLLALANGWPATAATFSTAQPRAFQAGGAAFGALLIAVVGAVAIGLVGALAHAWLSTDRRAPVPWSWGIALGLGVAGAADLAGWAAEAITRPPGYAGADAFLPFLAPVFGTITGAAFFCTGLLILGAAGTRFRGHPVVPSIVAFVVMSLGVLAVPEALRTPVVRWVPLALFAIALLAWLVRVVGRMPPLAPVVVGVMVGTGVLEDAVRSPYPGARAGAVVGVILVAWGAVVWSRALAGGATPSEPSSTATSGGP